MQSCAQFQVGAVEFGAACLEPAPTNAADQPVGEHQQVVRVDAGGSIAVPRTTGIGAGPLPRMLRQTPGN